MSSDSAAGVEFGIAADIRHAVAAADVQLGQDDAVPGPDVGHRGDHPADRLAEQRRVGDLRPDVAVQSGQRQKRMATTRFTASAAWPSPSVKPNFWSLTPVITAAWPWMSMSGVTRTSTR